MDEVTATLSALEIEDLVTVRDVTTVVQRLEMVTRISAEIDDYLIELGADGRLLALQLDELMGPILPDRRLVLRDYLGNDASVPEVAAQLSQLSATDLIDLSTIAHHLGVGGADGRSLDEARSPRGFRMLAQIPRLSDETIATLVTEAGPLQKLLAASPEDLAAAAGIDAIRAHSIREGLSRLAESSILERYV